MKQAISPKHAKQGLALAVVLAIALVMTLMYQPAMARADDAPLQEGNPPISFVYMANNEQSTLDEHYVVVGFETKVADAELVFTDMNTGSTINSSAEQIEPDGAALFSVTFPQASQYQLTSIHYLPQESVDWAEYELSTQNRSQGGVINVHDAISQTDEVDTEAYTVSPNGEPAIIDAQEDGPVMEALELDSINGRSRSADANGDGIFTIVLDPGHGGCDPGAVAHNLRESDLTLRIATYCKNELSKYARTKVHMTRTGDEFVDLKKRSALAKSVNADLFISFHINSSPATSASGAEVWIPNQASWYQAFHGLSEELANKILDKFTSLELVDRGTMWDSYEVNGVRKYYPDGSWADSLSVIRECRQNGIMAILLEHGFISNPQDAVFLSSSANLEKLGLSTARTIVEHYGLSLPQPLFGFKDVYEYTDHSAEIGWLAASGISQGFPDGTFRGLANVARQDMAAFLYRLAGSPTYTPSDAEKQRFPDVNNTTPHAKEIWWLASTGITTGFPDGTFRGLSPVARQDMAAFLRRFAQRFIDASAISYLPSDTDKRAFKDVNSSTPHAEDIWWLASKRVSTGFPDNTYRGLSSVVRQDMAAFLYRLNNLPAYTPTTADRKAFKDVVDSTSHAADIWWLAANGISTGFPDGTFRGGSGIARQDLAAFLYRLAGSPDYSPSTSDITHFTDVDENTPHAREIWWTVSKGILDDPKTGTYRPMDTVTRSEMAALMHRYYDSYANSDLLKFWTPTNAAKARFADVSSSTPHAQDIWWIGAAGISTGFENGDYIPNGNVVRQDMAAFLHRLHNLTVRNPESFQYKIMGKSEASARQMAMYFNSIGSPYPKDAYKDKGARSIEDFTKIIVEEASAEGVKAEVVFCQAMKETGWLKFGGSVKALQCNFAGIGATNAAEGGATFPDVRTGIRAQVQHLKAYASNESLVNHCVDPRFSLVKRGSAPTLLSLNGKWAVPGDGYGEGIYQMIQKLNSF